MGNETRWGLTIPFEGAGLGEIADLAREMAAAGFTDLWSFEAATFDGVVPLAAAGAAVPTLQLGTAILPVHTRGPALLAMTAASMASLVPGRFTLGIGASSPAIVERWNGIAYDRPFGRVRDTLRFLRSALAGERIDQEYETFSIRGFRLAEPPPVPPLLMLAALRPGMLRLAAAESDGAILNWLSADDVTRVREVTGPETTLVARIFVCVSEDADTVRSHARRLAAAYLTVPAYAEQQRWLGRSDVLETMWTRWHNGDRAGAASSVPDEVVDDLVLHGSADECRRKVQAYVDRGIDVPVIYAMPFGTPPIQTARLLSPSHASRNEWA
jgi:probable F420-dependent oxidoreductase